MLQELEGWKRARPVRVAFLVEEGEHDHLTLDGIVADCYSRWGGRFSLIVPCADKRISQAFWSWLEAYDPDIVYSYVALADVDVLELHERIGPSEYVVHQHHGNPRLDIAGFRPRFDGRFLSSLSTIFRMARHRPFGTELGPLRIIDSWHTETPTRFLTDNFGTYHASFGTSIYPFDAQAAASLLTIVSQDKREDSRFAVPRNLDAVPDEFTALQMFAKGKVSSLSVASAHFAPKLELQRPGWSDSFHLVVGNSFADRILFWNARLLYPAWLDNDICCLRIDPDQLHDLSKFEPILELLKWRNHVNDGSGGQSHVKVRSASLTAEKLYKLECLLIACGLRVATEAVTGPEAAVPSGEVLRTACEGHRHGTGLKTRLDWTRFRWSAPNVQCSIEPPEHLADAPPRQTFITGSWCTEYLLQHDGPKPRSANENRWLMPRRWRMAGAFKVSYGGADQPHRYPARRSRRGCLAIVESLDHPIETISVPAADQAILYALQVDGSWADATGRCAPPVLKNKVAWAEPSNEARYLTGVLGMTGGLRSASGFLLHPFLTKMFASLGGTPHLPIDKVQPTVARLRKMAPRYPMFDLTNSAERHTLGTLIVKAAQGLRSPQVFLKYQYLKRAWTNHREEYWARQNSKPKGSDEMDWDALEERSLDECLVEMRRRQLLFQGHQWTCPDCHHRNWVNLAELVSVLACAVCKGEADAPISIEWLFRPNEFLIESLRDHSVLSLVWVLTALADRAKESFIYTGPTWFGFDPGDRSPSAEADLLVLADGKAFVCEIKSSWTSLRPSDIDELVLLAEKLRPDVALLAVMEAGDGPAAKLAEARAKLEASGITFELMTDPGPHVRDDSYLSAHFE